MLDKNTITSQISGTPVLLQQIAPYLLINGIYIQNISELERGTGTTIQNLGYHIDNNGDGADVQWAFE